MSTVLMELKKYRNELNESYISKKTTMDNLLKSEVILKGSISELNTDYELKEKAAEFLRKLGSRAREQAKGNVELMVSNALQFIFEDDVQFKIVYDEKRGRPEAQFFIVSNIEGEVVEADPTESEGGGYADVCSVTLRIALAELFGIKGPMILDEPTKHLSSRYSQNFALFIRQVSEQFNRQIIMISHNLTLVEFGDISYLVTERNGVSHLDRRDNEFDDNAEEV